MWEKQSSIDRLKNIFHQQARGKLVLKEIPKKADLKNGVPVMSITEAGVFEYIKLDGIVYRTEYTIAQI